MSTPVRTMASAVIVPRSPGCYFGRGRRSSATGTPYPAPPMESLQAVDLVGQRVVVLGHAALAVRRQREADLVPPVDENVRVVVALLGDLGDLVDEGHRTGEVLEL